MATSPLAGQTGSAGDAGRSRPARARLLRAPAELDDPDQLVAFGTSGHRGSSLRGSFNEAHILAITQAICDYRGGQGIDGPLYLGKDTHALSGPAQRTALEVLAANGVETVIQRDDGVTPTPVISRAILVRNRGRAAHPADGIVVTPSHNPPEDGGFKYNPPHGGPADTDVTKWVQDRANALLRAGNAGVKRVPYATAVKAGEHASGRLRPPLCRGPAERRGHGRHPRRPPRAGGGPAGRGGRALLGPHQCRLRARHRRRQSGDRSAVRLHDAGPRRQDPHGLLEPACHGAAGGPQGSSSAWPLPTIPTRTATAS